MRIIIAAGSSDGEYTGLGYGILEVDRKTLSMLERRTAVAKQQAGTDDAPERLMWRDGSVDFHFQVDGQFGEELEELVEELSEGKGWAILPDDSQLSYNPTANPTATDVHYMGIWTDEDFSHTAYIKHTGVSVETRLVKVADILAAIGGKPEGPRMTTDEIVSMVARMEPGESEVLDSLILVCRNAEVKA